MDRRSFVKGVGAFLATAAGGGLGGCASLHRSERFREPENIAAFIGAVEQKMQAVRSTRLTPELATAQAQLGLPAEHFSEFMASMALVGAYRYSSESVQEESLFQQRMMEEGPKLAAHAFRTANALEAIPRKQLRAMHSELKRDPALMDEVVDQFQLVSLETGGDSDRTRELSAHFRRMTHRLRKIGPRKTFAQYIERIDTVAGEQGVARADWDEERFRTVEWRDRPPRAIALVGLLLFALGPVVFLGGVMSFFNSPELGGLLCAVGVGLFILGLIMMTYALVRVATGSPGHVPSEAEPLVQEPPGDEESPDEESPDEEEPPDEQ